MAMTRQEAFLEYEKALAEITEQARKSTETARGKLREQLQVLRDNAHKELKAIRVIAQKTKRSKQNAG